MYAEFRYLDGPFAGETRVVRKDFATLGRDPLADVTFDAERDSDVSGRHAAVFRQGNAWSLRDLGSAGGTWVNDARLKGDRTLAAGDVIRLGAEGPRLAFTAGVGEPEAGHITRIPPPAPAPTPAPELATPLPAASPRPTTPGPPARGGRRPGVPFAALAILGLLGALAFLVVRNRRPLEAERSAFLARAARLGDSAAARHQRLLDIATFDAAGIAARGAGATALVVTGYQDGRWLAGSGAVLRIRGDTAWIATVRQLAGDPSGRAPIRIAVLLKGSTQYARADVAAPAESGALALVRVRIRGASVAEAVLGDLPGAEQPVALVAVPLDPDGLPGNEWRRTGVSVTGLTAAVLGVETGRLTLDGYGSIRPMGSLVLDREGRVIGMVTGVDSASAGRRVPAAPVARLKELVERLPRPE